MVAIVPPQLLPAAPPGAKKLASPAGMLAGARRGCAEPCQTEADFELVTRSLDGERRAFDELMTRHERRLWSVAAAILRDCDEAFDAVQDAFLLAYRSLRTFRGEASFSTWVTKICVRECLDRIRSRVMRRKLSALFGRELATEPAIETATGADHALARRLRAALDELPARQRTVLCLRAFEEMTIPEIADALDLAEGTVKSHLFRATRAMRSLLEDLR